MARDLTVYNGAYADEQAKSATWEAAVNATDQAQDVFNSAEQSLNEAKQTEQAAKIALDQARGNTTAAYDAVPGP